ncbi:MAG: metallophosphoesterase, partial [Bacteroidales bacterium]|nr:metallophosphoesterase [Bacteroidales bacterium]
PHSFSLSAHNHTVSHQFISHKEGWLNEKPHHHFNAGAVCGDWWQGALDANNLPDATMRDGSPNGYVILSISHNSYSFDYKVARYPETYQMNIFLPKVLTDNSNLNGWSNDEMYVNFFAGSSKDKVRFRVNEGEWREMKYTIGPDPSYARIRLMWDDAEGLLPGARPSAPDKCYHLWKATLPSGIPQGYCKIEVEATDIFGNKHSAFQVTHVK